MKKINFLAFTLVELVIVTILLAILGTISYISLQGYNSNARDSVRANDLSNIQKALDLYTLKNRKYPIPSNPVDITYSGGLAWKQGTFGIEPYNYVGSMNKLPVDPLTGNEYDYSVTSDRFEYQVAAVYESTLVKNKELLTQTYADGNISGFAKIVGNYNGVSLKALSGSTTYILAVPTIISGDLSLLDVESIVSNKKLVYDGTNNLPASYSGTQFKVSEQQSMGLGIRNNNSLLVYSGNYTTLVGSGGLMLATLEKVQNVYSGSILDTYPLYNNIVTMDVLNNQSKATDLANLIILGSSSLSLILPTVDGSCATQPSYTYASFTEGTPTSANQSWQNSNSGNACYYTCTEGYTGATCSVAPTQCAPGMTQLTLSNGQIWKCMDSGASTVWNGTDLIEDCQDDDTVNCNSSLSRVGYYYQWGATTETYTIGYVNTDDNVWGGGGTTISAGTYATVSALNKTLMKGPCPTGWHVPTAYEWELACNSITGESVCNWVNYNPLISSKLKLPFGGLRNSAFGYYGGQTYHGRYRTSTPNGTRSNTFYFEPLMNYMSDDDNNRATGINIRCMKNY